MGKQARRHRVRVAVATPLLLVVAFSNAACAQPKLERLSRELSRSIPQKGDGVVAGSIVMRLTEVKVKGSDPSALGSIGQVPKISLAAAGFVVQPGRERAALVGPKGLVTLTDGRILYSRRKLNGPADKRPWARLELARLDDIDVPRLEVLREQMDAGSLAVLSPDFALDLLSGVLTGSLKQKALPGGGKSIEFNASIEKSNRELDLSDDERDDRERLLRSMAVTTDIFKGVARLNADGSLRALQLEVKEQPNKRTTAKVLLELTIDNKVGAAVSLAPPARNETIRVGSLSALRNNILDQLSPEKVADLPTSLPSSIEDVLAGAGQ